MKNTEKYFPAVFVSHEKVQFLRSHITVLKKLTNTFYIERVFVFSFACVCACHMHIRAHVLLIPLCRCVSAHACSYLFC